MSKTGKAFGWKLLESFGVQGIQFILQIILARLLSPEHYGALSIMIIFTSLANVFIQAGFNTALIQKKDIDEEDYSSVFWVSILIAVVLYIAIFFASPVIANFYDMNEIVAPLRVLALMLLVATLLAYSILKLRSVESINTLGAMFKIVGSFTWASGAISTFLTVIISFFIGRSVINILPLALFFVVLMIRSIIFVINESKLYLKQLGQQEAEQMEV